jgi:hypothetical protein
MKINDLFESQEQHLDEGPIGQAIGKGVGAVARGAGAVAGGAVGAWQAAKQGYQAGKATVSGQPAQGQTAGAAPAGGGAVQGGASAASGSAAPATNQTQAAAPVGNAAAPAAPAGNAAVDSGAAPAGGGQQDQQAKVGVGQINKIIPTLRTRDLQSVKKNLDATIAKKQKQPADAAAPAGNTPAADAGQQAAAPSGPQPDQVVKLASGENYKWLGQQWVQVDPASGKQVGSFVEPNIQKSLTKLAAQQSAASAAPAAGTPNLKVVPGGKSAAPAAAVAESRDFRSKFLEMLI